nr:glycosyltransferase family 4 protein [Algoriphagus sp.]
MPKIIRITTVPLSLKLLLAGQMNFLREKGWDIIMVSSGGSEIKSIEKKENVRHEIIPFTRQITPWQDLKCVIKLYFLLKKEKPNIVHTHTPKAGLLGMIAANLAGVPIRIHTVAGILAMASNGRRKKFLEKAEKFTYSNATNIWPNSKGLYDFVLKQKLCPESKMRVIAKGSSNGVDLEKFNRKALKENHLVAATMRILPSEDEYLILAVGRLVKDKGVEELVEAFLGSKIVNQSKLILLGEFEQKLNPLNPTTIQTIQDHPRIVQIDWTDHVAHYMALADVLVHASHREGFPNVLLEAGAMQLPVICSDIIGNTDLISQQKTGLIFPVKNVEVLREALEFAFVKRDHMIALAENLYQEVKTNYNRKFLQESIFSAYQELLKAHQTNE